MQTLSRWRDRAVVTTRAYPELRAVLDVVGLALVAALALVAIVVGRRTGTDAGPFLALIGGVVAVVVAAGVIGARTHRAVVPLALAVGASWYAYRWRLDTLGGPLDGPFGYRNASGAFLAVAAVAWLMTGAALRRAVFVVLCALPAAALSVLAVRSAAGAAAVVLAWLALIGLAGRAAAKVAIALCAGALAAVLAATIALGIAYDPARGPTGVGATLADAGLTERRLAVWHDAWEAMVTEPGGAGLDAFRLVSPTARADPDAFQAHQEFLERGVELGVAGAVLTLLLFVWAFLRLWRVPRADGVTALGAAAVAVVGVHGCVDYVLHTPAVLLGAAALLGTALLPRREEMWE